MVEADSMKYKNRQRRHHRPTPLYLERRSRSRSPCQSSAIYGATDTSGGVEPEEEGEERGFGEVKGDERVVGTGCGGGWGAGESGDEEGGSGSGVGEDEVVDG